MSLVTSLTGSFSERNLLLHGLLGLLSAAGRLTASMALEPAAPDAQATGSSAEDLESTSPLVLAVLGLIAVHERLEGELNLAVPMPPPAATSPIVPDAGAWTSPPNFDLLR